MASWRPGGRLTVVAGVITLFVGCAPEATPLLREDLDRFRADLRRVEQEIQASRSALLTEIQATDRRTAQSLTELQRGVARLGARLDDLGRETGQLQGRVDELRRRVDTLALQFDAVGAPRGTSTGPSSPSATVAQRAAPPSTQASDLYQTAYIDFTRGNYNLAVAAFREYLKLYPSTSLAENAQFWIGESHFSLARAHQARGEADRAVQELERAVQEFRKVVDRLSPGGPGPRGALQGSPGAGRARPVSARRGPPPVPGRPVPGSGGGGQGEGGAGADPEALTGRGPEGGRGLP